MRKQSTNNGITLIALIITIAVLLILASITIRSVTDGGILSQAQDATKNYSDEQEELEIKKAIIDFSTKKQDGKNLADFLKEKEWCKDAVETEDGKVDLTTKRNVMYKVDENGSVELVN